MFFLWHSSPFNTFSSRSLFFFLAFRFCVCLPLFPRPSSSCHSFSFLCFFFSLIPSLCSCLSSLLSLSLPFIWAQERWPKVCFFTLVAVNIYKKNFKYCLIGISGIEYFKITMLEIQQHAMHSNIIVYCRCSSVSIVSNYWWECRHLSSGGARIIKKLIKGSL